MGYGIRAGLVEENSALLDAILTSVKQGQSFELQAAPADLYTKQWTLRRILKATEVLLDEAEGKFANLAQRVTLKMRPPDTIIIEPKGGIAVEQKRYNERDVLAMLVDSKSRMQLIEFFPTSAFEEDSFAEELSRMGWTLHLKSRMELEEGQLRYGVERTEKGASGFEALD